MICLYQKATILYQLGNRESETIQVADECLKLCTYVGEIYSQTLNDLGVLYSQCRQVEKSQLCFERAIALMPSLSDEETESGIKLKAVVLQNIGANFNCLGDYNNSIQSNKDAVRLYERVHDTNGCCQCYNNMAFAFSQLGDIESAKHNYSLALEAAKNSCDADNEVHALEGLSSVAFHQKRYDQCQNLLQTALVTVPRTKATDNIQRRLISKLTDGVRVQVSAQSHKPQHLPVSHNGRDRKVDSKGNRNADRDRLATAYKLQLEQSTDSDDQQQETTDDAHSDN
jgi:tetratricopeptide (TPR) repeat protein